MRTYLSTLAKQRGYTLLELLVVISIIGILIALGTVSFTTAQQRARNAKRQGDMKTVAGAWEQKYAATNSVYAAANGSTMAACTPATTYLPSGTPVDPKNDATYFYSANCSSTAYCLCARLEGTNLGNSNIAADGTCSGMGTTGDYFCVKNQQ